MTVTNRHIPAIQTGEMPGGLAQTARRLPAGEDWKGGVTFTPQCGTTGIWPYCPAPDRPEKTIVEKPDPARFDPFLVYGGSSCSGAPVTDDLRELARGALERGYSSQLASQLVFSDPDVGNPDLTTVATDITPITGPVSLKNSIAGLLSALAVCGGGEAMLHIPLLALPFLTDLGLVERNGLYFLGAIPVSLDHYPNLGGLSPASPSEAYLYLTRPVEYETTGDGEIEYNSYKGRLNESVLVAEKLAVLRFDPCCAYAINAVICDGMVPEATPPETGPPTIENVVVTP